MSIPPKCDQQSRRNRKRLYAINNPFKQQLNIPSQILRKLRSFASRLNAANTYGSCAQLTTERSRHAGRSNREVQQRRQQQQRQQQRRQLKEEMASAAAQEAGSYSKRPKDGLENDGNRDSFRGARAVLDIRRHMITARQRIESVHRRLTSMFVVDSGRCQVYVDFIACGCVVVSSPTHRTTVSDNHV